MKFYQNKITNEIIGIENMRQVIDFPNQHSINCGFKDYSYKIVYDMICPNKLIGNGVVSFCITYNMLKSNYKRIKREIALTKYPVFKQYVYSDLLNESKQTEINGFDILHKQTF